MKVEGPIPVVFDWDYEYLIGQAEMVDDTLVIKVTQAQFIDSLGDVVNQGTVQAVSIGIAVKHDIEYLPKEEESDGS